MTNAPDIQHDLEKGRFSIVRDGDEAFLDYRLDDEGGVDFVKTWVPHQWRGGGVAAQLVERGFDWAEDEGLKMRASCSYAERKLARRRA
ncbi:MAG: GNAT family N-acetyltransferase [Pseudomonadota bacterium]